MRRRDVLAALAASVDGCNGIARAQSAKFYRIGFLSPVAFGTGSMPGSLLDAVRRLLVQHGLSEGANFEFVKRGAEARYERLLGLMAESLAAKVDVVIATSYPVALAVKEATQTVPIVTVNTGEIR